MEDCEYKSVHLNTAHADKHQIVDDRSYFTYYFKTPIVLNDDHDVKVTNFSLKKKINDELIIHENELESVLNNSLDREILPRPYNTNVEIVSVVNVILYEWDGAAFQPTAARATISSIPTQPDLTTGQIQVDAITTPGTGFVLNNFLYVDKDVLTNTFNTYTNRWAELKITDLADDDVALTLATYADAVLQKATTDPINNRTYDDVILYEDDGAGWYIASGVTANVEVVTSSPTQSFANINILNITNGGSGLTLNQILYIDKSYLIDGEPTMTYTGARFAKYQVTSLVNGVGAVVLSANVEILANPREIAFVTDLISNVPLLKLEGGSYVESGAIVDVSIFANPSNDNRGKANINAIVNGGRGFLPFETYYIDKAAITINNNTYDPASRYASYVVDATTNNDSLGVVFATNYGFNLATLGDYYYDVPGKDTRIYINLFNDQTYGNMARVRYTDGIKSGFAVGDEIVIPNADVVSVSTGVSGWAKTSASGSLKIEVLAVTTLSYPEWAYEVTLENLLYYNNNYFNSNNNFKPLLMRLDGLNKPVEHNNVVLTLTRQIINYIIIGLNRKIEGSDNIALSLLLKNKNYLINK
jgi:hypothetical protein